MLHAAGETVWFGRFVGRDYPVIGGLRFLVEPIMVEEKKDS